MLAAAQAVADGHAAGDGVGAAADGEYVKAVAVGDLDAAEGVVAHALATEVARAVDEQRVVAGAALEVDEAGQGGVGDGDGVVAQAHDQLDLGDVVEGAARDGRARLAVVGGHGDVVAAGAVEGDVLVVGVQDVDVIRVIDGGDGQDAANLNVALTTPAGTVRSSSNSRRARTGAGDRRGPRIDGTRRETDGSDGQPCGSPK